MLSSNKAWNWLCISEALKVGPHSVAEKKMQLKLVDRSLWKSGRANTTSHSCNVFELMQYFISIFSPPLCEQRQQMGEKENRINIDWKYLFKRGHFFMILKWHPDLLKSSLITLKFELYPYNFHAVSLLYFTHHSSALCCLPYCLANSNPKDFIEKKWIYRAAHLNYRKKCCHFVETFSLFFVHKVLLFVYEVSQETWYVYQGTLLHLEPSCHSLCHLTAKM